MPGFAWRKEKSRVMPRARKYPEELLERGTAANRSKELPS